MEKLFQYTVSAIIATTVLGAGNLSAATFSFVNSGGLIKDDSFVNGPTDFEFNVSGVPDLPKELNLTIDSLEHPDLFELELFLLSPGGEVLTLAQALVGNQLQGTTLSDRGSTNIDIADPPYTGIFSPSGQLGFAEPSNITSFAGFSSNPNGIWKLRIYDTIPGNAGTLERVTLRISVPEPQSLSLLGLGTLVGFASFLKRKL